MKLFAGLGNPGSKYTNTRHNIGFKVIDRVADIYNVKVNSAGYQGLYHKGIMQKQHVILLKPMTYMNLSGESVSKIISMYKISLDNVLIIYDDVSLIAGKMRIRIKGSAGGHNGMDSIIECCNNINIPRLRIGIGNENIKRYNANYVLTDFTNEEEKIMHHVIQKAAEAIIHIITYDDITRTMNEYNTNKSIQEIIN